MDYPGVFVDIGSCRNHFLSYSYKLILNYFFLIILVHFPCSECEVSNVVPPILKTKTLLHFSEEPHLFR